MQLFVSQITNQLIFKKCLGLWIKLNGLNERRCYVRASRRHHLCLWSTMRILALYYCWRSKFNYSQKIVTKCDGIITNCNSLVYYKVRRTVITNCDSFFITKCDTVYYKLRQVLQSAMIITNCDSTIFPFVLLKIKWPPTQAINNDRSLRVLNYICIIYLFVLAQGAPLSLSKRKVPQVPNEKQFKGIKCKRDLSVENNKQTKKKKTSTQAPVKKFCVRASFKFLCFWWQN